MAEEALLGSWRDGAARRAITDFVRSAGDEHSPGFVPPGDRVAVFDNDGTLWSEKPLPVQLDFTLTGWRSRPRRPVAEGQAAIPRGRREGTTGGSARRW